MFTPEQEQFLDKCREDGFDNWQINQIRYGFRRDLAIEQIKVFAKKEFNPYQMSQICDGFINGLTFEQVNLFARPEFTWKQMWQIRDMFKKYKRLSTIQKKVALMILES